MALFQKFLKYRRERSAHAETFSEEDNSSQSGHAVRLGVFLFRKFAIFV